MYSQKLTFFSQNIQEVTSGTNERYPGFISIKNDEEKPVDLKIYQLEQIFQCDGSTKYEEIDSNKNLRSNSKWILTPSYIRIPPKGIGKLNYTVDVPDDNSLVGSYWSAIMVEATDDQIDTTSISVQDSKTKKRKTIDVALKQKYRFAFCIVTHIKETGVRKVEFENIKIVRNEKNEKNLQFNIKNNGERGFSIPTVWMDLYNSSGLKVMNLDKDKFDGESTRLFPGTCVLQKINLNNVPQGLYKAIIYFDGGGDDLFAHQVELKVE